MARQPQLPHFPHHHREMLLTRRRFSGALLAICVVAAVAVGIQVTRTQAATMYTVSGRVYNMTTGAGLPNVIIDTCNANPDVVTNSSGYFSISFPLGHYYCVQYVSGAPATVVFKDAPNQNPERVGQKLYNWQVAGKNCYHNAAGSGCHTSTWEWDRSVDSGMDLRFVSVPTPTPTPKPPTPKPKATPKPVVKATPKPAAAPPPASAPATALATPTNFQALGNSETAYISLQWTGVSDALGVHYVLERSTDQTRWEVIKDNLSDARYQDETTAYGTRYFYRLKAVNGAGTASGYVTADAQTPEFVGNLSADSDTLYSSDDQLASVIVRVGAINVSANCSVVKDDSELKVEGRTVAAGPYRLLCKDSSGRVITEVQYPVLWKIDVKEAIKGLDNTTMVSINEKGEMTDLTEVTYDPDGGLMEFEVAGATSVALLGTQKANPFIMGLIVSLGLILLAAAIGFIFLLRRGQKRNYEDYLRAKYYNI